MKKKQLPEYDITETINMIDNPEMDIINGAKNSLLLIFRNKLSDADLQRIKERSGEIGHN